MNAHLARRAGRTGLTHVAATKDICGVPLDSEYFDASGIEKTPDPGREVLLARFELQSQYCGVFENFSQFVGNAEGDLLTVIHTPGLEWLILVNRRPLSPFLKLDHIVNTWGLGGFPVAIRLDENAMVEFVVRNVNLAADSQIQKVGGRITGRYWYNPAYGDANSRNGQFR